MNLQTAAVMNQIQPLLTRTLILRAKNPEKRILPNIPSGHPFQKLLDTSCASRERFQHLPEGLFRDEAIRIRTNGEIDFGRTILALKSILSKNDFLVVAILTGADVDKIALYNDLNIKEYIEFRRSEIVLRDPVLSAYKRFFFEGSIRCPHLVRRAVDRTITNNAALAVKDILLKFADVDDADLVNCLHTSALHHKSSREVRELIEVYLARRSVIA